MGGGSDIDISDSDGVEEEEAEEEEEEWDSDAEAQVRACEQRHQAEQERAAQARAYADALCPGMTHAALEALKLHNAPEAFDTVQELPGLRDGNTTLAQFEERVLGGFRGSTSGGHLSYGTLLVGEYDGAYPDAAHWGPGVAFGNDAYFVRSWPPRRLGKPLLPGETRMLDVLVCALDRVVPGPHRNQIAKAVLWLPPSPRLNPRDRQWRPGRGAINTGRLCHGEHAVPLVGLHVFQVQGATACARSNAYAGHGGFMLVPGFYAAAPRPHEAAGAGAGASASETDAAAAAAALWIRPPRSERERERRCAVGGKAAAAMAAAVERRDLVPVAGGHRFAIAAGLLDLSPSRSLVHFTDPGGIVTKTPTNWSLFTTHAHRSLATGLEEAQRRRAEVLAGDAGALLREEYRDKGGLLKDFPASLNVHELASAVDYAVIEAEYLCDRVGPVGILDMMSHPFHIGALPHELSRPCGLPLLLVLATRVAAYPDRFPCGQKLAPLVPGADRGFAEDEHAARRLAQMLESALGDPIARRTEAHADAPRGRTWAIDALGDTLVEMVTSRRVARLGADCPLTAEDDLADTVNNAFCTMHRIGCALALDLAGSLPALLRDPKERRRWTAGPYGEASGDPSVLDLAEGQAEWAAGLGCAQTEAAGGPAGPPRMTSRAARLKRFVSLSRSVDEWIRTGLHCGAVATPDPRYARDPPEAPSTDGAPPTAREAAAAAAEEAQAVEARGRANQERVVELAAEAVKKTEAHLSAAKAASASAATGSAKKGSQKAKVRAARKEAAHAKLNARTAAIEREMDKRAAECAVPKLTKVQVAEGRWVDGASVEVRGATHYAARKEGARFLDYTILTGLARRMSVGPLAAFAVMPSAKQACCACFKDVHVLSNLMFGGCRYSACTGCGARRCIACIDVILSAADVCARENSRAADAAEVAAARSCRRCAERSVAAAAAAAGAACPR